ncbi:LysR family transcriptional regulator [Thiomonas bhubaneswarensis]|uniref:DNA-binding transcriptional regulator, LysR family n=1 Tax=Thiomonas bhubaneswarensis TaxID=339866 RepID=A0A0K6HUI7_9BURK|nr:LysR family transcriptional regulator [Thiomonas bhubaneswarensis]CUA94565.1 DNA-binding transcriptional regulator, LysR family [Thiomonas bhubaneswarensis]
MSLPPATRNDLLWQQVHWLGSIATHGSVTAAAQHLGVSKAAVSQQLAALERRIGVPLVRRTTRTLRLTEAGQRLVDETAPAFAQIVRSVGAVHDLADTPRGLVRVTAPVALGRQHMAPHILSFLRRYPDIQVELDLSDRLTNLPQEGFDLAVRHVAAPPQSHVAWKLCETRSVLVASSAYLRRHGEPGHPDDLVRHACLTYLRPGAAVWMFERPDPDLPEPERVRVTVQGPLRANTSEVLREAARAGLGIALTPDFSLDPGGRPSTLRVVLPQWRAVGFFGQAIYAIRPWSPGTPRAVQLLVEHLRASLAQGF